MPFFPLLWCTVLLYPGNFPKNSSGYAIDELMMYMVKRAAVEGGVALPQEYDLRVIS